MQEARRKRLSRLLMRDWLGGGLDRALSEVTRWRGALAPGPGLGGDHRTGPEHARADMFDGRTVVITPTEHTRTAAVTEVTGLWQALGANVHSMTPSQHDAALALTRHLRNL